MNRHVPKCGHLKVLSAIIFRTASFHRWVPEVWQVVFWPIPTYKTPPFRFLASMWGQPASNQSIINPFSIMQGTGVANPEHCTCVSAWIPWWILKCYGSMALKKKKKKIEPWHSFNIVTDFNILVRNQLIMRGPFTLTRIRGTGASHAALQH